MFWIAECSAKNRTEKFRKKCIEYRCTRYDKKEFHGQFNNILSVLGKESHEMNAVHLVKTFCLPTLCENAVFCENAQRKIYGAWNNCFRHIFNNVVGVRVLNPAVSLFYLTNVIPH